MAIRIIEEGWPAGDWQGTGSGQIVDRSPNCKIGAGETVAFHMKVPANLVGANLTGAVSCVQYIDPDAFRISKLSSVAGDLEGANPNAGVSPQASFIGYKADPNDHSDPHRDDYMIVPGQDLYFNVKNDDPSFSGRVSFSFAVEYPKQRPVHHGGGGKHGQGNG